MRLKRLLLPAILLLVSVFVKAQKSNEFTVLQWNVWQEGTMIPGGYDAIINEIVRLKPDFVTFSEVRNYNKTNFTARVCASLQEKGLKYYSFYTYDTGLLSKHPITDSLTVFEDVEHWKYLSSNKFRERKEGSGLYCPPGLSGLCIL